MEATQQTCNQKVHQSRVEYLELCFPCTIFFLPWYVNGNDNESINLNLMYIQSTCLQIVRCWSLIYQIWRIIKCLMNTPLANKMKVHVVGFWAYIMQVGSMILSNLCRLIGLEEWNVWARPYSRFGQNSFCQCVPSIQRFDKGKEKRRNASLPGPTWLKCLFDPPLVLCPLGIITMMHDY